MRAINALSLWAGVMFGQTSGNKGYFVQEIKDGLYWVSDGAYNTMFLVTIDGVIAVDALPTLGEKQLAAIREVTDKPIQAGNSA